jgi:uncharacterized protein (TIGR03492 family)
MGLLKSLIDMFYLLRNHSPDIVISVGDPFNLLFTSIGTHKKVFFISTDQGHSGWVRGFSNTEMGILRRYALWTFTRDRKTVELLDKKRFKEVSYLGNPLMDCIDEPKFFLPEGITLLPGTRKDCWKNLTYLLDVIKEIPGDHRYYVPVNTNSELVILDGLKKDYKLLEWNYGYRVNTPKEVYIGKGLFSEMVNSSILVVGLSGSGNEQSAGLGRPVVSFYIDGVQFNEKFIKEQKKLLDDALIVTTKEKAPSVISQLLKSPEEIKRRGNIGRERMGERGAISKIAEFIEGWIYESRR